MRTELITQRDDRVIRRHTLEPGEATPWHTDACRRFTVVVRGDEIRSMRSYPGQVDDSDGVMCLELETRL